ncbi:MAG: cardiolipin synthase ClsB [Pseudomonadota bacterium]
MIKGGNRLTLLENGAAYFPELIAALDGARREIHLETYIFAADATGLAVADALMRAARRGVVTRLLLDGFGSRALGQGLLDGLRSAGVEVLVFRPDIGMGLRRKRLRRMHRKLAVVDARVGFVGGINILDDLHGRHLSTPRRDYAARVEGPLVADMHAAAQRLWRLVTWSRLGLRRGEDAWLKPRVEAVGTQRGTFLTRDNLRRRRSIETAYLHAIHRARRDILIANAYFMPGVRFRHALIDAARRGVRVRLLMQGHSDHPFYQTAARALYRHFLENGLEVYEYHATELHAKAAVVDGQWATVGSSNIDPLSLLLAREANLVVHDPGFAGELQASLEGALDSGAHRIHRRAWSRIPWYARFASWLAYGLIRGAMGLAGYAQGWDRPPRRWGQGGKHADHSGPA